MNPALRHSAAHAFVDSIVCPVLSAHDGHHLEHVLRLRPGEGVSVADGSGSWRMCTFAAGGALVPVGDVQHDDPRRQPLTVGFALAKGDRPEWIVQKLTEIGIDRIVLVDAERSIVRWDAAKAARNLERLGKVAREASMQSRRTRLPSIAGPFSVAQLAGMGVAMAEPDGGPIGVGLHTVLVGPEGGWTAAELCAGSATVGLGPTILRVETAALVAALRLTAEGEDTTTF